MSVASLWEIAIKAQIGKLTLRAPFDAIFPVQLIENEMTVLPVTLAHVQKLHTLPLYHRDPLDRLLIAQALAEELLVATSDPAFAQYPVEIV